MKKLFLNPPASPTPKSYHHAVAVEGGRTIYLSGQVAFDGARKIVGGDDVTHGDDFDVVAHQTLFDHCTKGQTTDASEPVDCYFYSHVVYSISMSVQIKEREG